MIKKTIQTRNLQMAYHEAGVGPLVVLLHGFPELGSTWRHQIKALAAAGYRAIAPDQRGYGGTDAPADIEAYSILDLVGDVIALLDALEADQAVVVGHDWGAPIAWATALLRPDRVRAVVGLSIPTGPRSSAPPIELMRKNAGDDYYMVQFQVPGLADARLAENVRESLLRGRYSASGDVPEDKRWVPTDGGFFDTRVLPGPDEVPAWLDAEHLDDLTENFERTGFTGGLNWYRNLDRNWRLMAPFDGMKILPPALFMTGEWDLEYAGNRGMIKRLKDFVPNLRETIIMPGAGHWLGEERPEEVNSALLKFLAEL